MKQQRTNASKRKQKPAPMVFWEEYQIRYDELLPDGCWHNGLTEELRVYENEVPDARNAESFASQKFIKSKRPTQIVVRWVCRV